MTVSITTTCPQCGTVLLERADLLLVVDALDGDAWYVFDCHSCVRRIVKEAPYAVVSALTLAEVRVCAVPAEVHERRIGAGSSLGPDDLLDAVLTLAGTDDLAALAANC